jgi:hypothetical protein
VTFEKKELFDPGAFDKPPLSGTITDRVMQPWNLPKNQKEKEAVERMKTLVSRLRKGRSEGDKHGRKTDSS